ncbi:hypothetical protein [Hyphomonas sp. GM-8P]|uniref:hypothetical protein n=1 Tax=Hyphomonas sp. GM-8P TaxID=1280945 RepID=UPI000DBFF53D|nr:hypothetical protein [Hyphomonas sp. GM-8P]RAN37981.1 hypothetical protein HY26_04590 [Hyphomonas sp. GM-8P]
MIAVFIVLLMMLQKGDLFYPRPFSPTRLEMAKMMQQTILFNQRLLFSILVLQRTFEKNQEANKLNIRLGGDAYD